MLYWIICSSCVISFFYIKPQPFQPADKPAVRCVISFFYIKPQHSKMAFRKMHSCVISFFYIKPQQKSQKFSASTGCVISFFYIKPQQNFRNPPPKYVVLYPSSTSNHNHKWAKIAAEGLCYILLLHQTTTTAGYPNPLKCCVISFFYIKPQQTVRFLE